MKKFVKRFITFKLFLILFLTVELLCVGAVFLRPHFALQKSSNQISNGDFELNDFNKWLNDYEKYSRLIKFDKGIRTDNNLFSAVEGYELIRKFDIPFFRLPHIEFDISDPVTLEREPPINLLEESRFPAGEKYILDEGEISSYLARELYVSNKKYLIPMTTPVFEKESTVVVGTGNRKDLTAKLTQELRKVQSENAQSAWYKNFTDEGLDTLDKVEIVNVFINSSQEEEVVAGKVELINKSCSDKIAIKLFFEPQSKLYYFNELEDLTLKDCTIQTKVDLVPVIPTLSEVVSCSDCKYAPIDKTTSLPSTYIPNLVGTGLSGGGMLTPETVHALKKMSDALANQGISIHVTSAYRSYSQQQSTFNYWVNTELAKGASSEVARQRANIYSAFPGHSEHQLGTTLDVKCAECDAFSKNPNLPLYKFLQEHAHEYGFVISYPQDKQHLTGYTYEPWHIRYIGVELASELQSRGYQSPTNTVYLSAFLREKGLY